MSNKSEAQLQDGLLKLKINLEENQIQKLLAYLALLIKWNKAYNLTSVRDEQEIITKHLLDSLACLFILKKEKIKVLADIGTGAGLPGIPLAIAQPEWQLVLVDSNSKKTAFLQQAKTELQLNNIQIETKRVEGVTIKVDAVISRAFASLNEMVSACEPLCQPKTILWAMKGKYPEAEINQLLETGKNYRVSAAHQLIVPGLSGDRCLLKLEMY